jgi:hypothetical protein
MPTQINDSYGGIWTVYHVSETCCPEAHNTRPGEWFFEPYCNAPGMPIAVYSHGYPTRTDAEHAAAEWGQVLARRATTPPSE